MFATLIDPDRLGGVGIAFTDRLGGFSTGELASLNLGRTDLDELDVLRANLAAVRSALDLRPIVALHQVHGIDVYDADLDERDWSDDAWLGDRAGGPALPVADAVITGRPGLALAVRVADCVPILFADAHTGLIGAAHAGRAGLLAGVLPATVAALRRRGAGQLRAWIGPHICGSCYEVGAELAASAAQQLPACASTTSWGTPAIDLGAGATAQLRELGVEVIDHASCTFTGDELFSHRADGPQTGRQLGLIWRVQ